MRRVIFMCLDAGIAGLILLPMFLYLNRRYFQDRTRTAWYFIMAVYLSGVYAVVGLPDIRYMRLDFSYNIIPFAYMFSDYRNSLLNVLLFMPLGFFLTVLWTKFRNPWWALLFGLGFSCLIEGMQIFTLRATDINDLMTNTTGTLIGWFLGATAAKLLPCPTPSENSQDVFAVCAISFGVMFFFQPFLADAILYFLY